MKLKKFAALLLAAAMVMGMAACTKDPAQSGAGGNNDANTQTTGARRMTAIRTMLARMASRRMAPPMPTPWCWAPRQILPLMNTTR